MFLLLLLALLLLLVIDEDRLEAGSVSVKEELASFSVVEWRSSQTVAEQ